MNIGLIDVDSHNFPNLPLMKLSQYHKKVGDVVEFVQWFDGEERPVSKYYDKVYMSKVFTESEDPIGEIRCGELVRGGSGYDLRNSLPYEVEHIYPDYSLYPDYKFALGFLTRGCPRCNHTFCITPKKDGIVSRKVADITEFWKGQDEIILLDQNLLACKDRLVLLDQLARSKSYVEFNGGLDIRYLTPEVAALLKRIKMKDLHFAWDDPKEDLYDKFVYFKTEKIYSPHNTGVYVLVNYWSSIEEDLYRVEKLQELGYAPFVMIYDKQCFVNSQGRWLKGVEEKYTREQLRHFKICQHLQRWCNSRAISKSCKFNEYYPYVRWMEKGKPVPGI